LAWKSGLKVTSLPLGNYCPLQTFCWVIWSGVTARCTADSNGHLACFFKIWNAPISHYTVHSQQRGAATPDPASLNFKKVRQVTITCLWEHIKAGFFQGQRTPLQEHYTAVNFDEYERVNNSQNRKEFILNLEVNVQFWEKYLVFNKTWLRNSSTRYGDLLFFGQFVPFCILVTQFPLFEGRHYSREYCTALKFFLLNCKKEKIQIYRNTLLT
jgi:hypothetical protein